jgi:hypothetical protein
MPALLHREKSNKHSNCAANDAECNLRLWRAGGFALPGCMVSLQADTEIRQLFQWRQPSHDPADAQAALDQ